MGSSNVTATFSEILQGHKQESPLRYVEFPYDFARLQEEEAIFKRHHREPIGNFKEEVDELIKDYLEDENYSFNEFVYDILCYGQKIREDLEDCSLPV